MVYLSKFLGWAFIIWTPIFLMLALAQVFIIVTFFLRDNGSRLINKHGIATPMFLGIVTFNYLLNFTWVFLFDRAYEHKWLVGLSSFTLFVIAVTNIISTGIFAKNISRNVHNFSTTYAVLYRIFLNGYCLYTTWTIIASLINMCQAIAYIPIDMRSSWSMDCCYRWYLKVVRFYEDWSLYWPFTSCHLPCLLVHHWELCLWQRLQVDSDPLLCSDLGIISSLWREAGHYS